MAKICCKALVSGRVQGVFYRASTQQQANFLGVTGYAKNLPDGRVEVLACGEQVDVEALINWCRQGPQHAIVQDVTSEGVAFTHIEGFSVC